jgi:hypothetical protein
MESRVSTLLAPAAAFFGGYPLRFFSGTIRLLISLRMGMSLRAVLSM